jgi:tripartite-type tricarboxylate transporter receptor subunit TctC
MTLSLLSRRLLLAAAAGALLPAPASAKDFPTQPVRLIVGTAAAGLNDYVARLVAPIMERELGQPVVVDNRPGAANKLALGVVAKATPDGHTLLVSSSAVLATAVTHSAMPADPIRDLEHISMIADGSFTFTLNSKVPAATTGEFIALAKKEPGKLKFGASGSGSAIHLAGEVFAQRSGIKLVAVQYTSAGQRVADLLANQIQMSINAIQVTGQHIKTGELKPLFVASTLREPGFPDIPTSVELGIPDVDKVSNWFGLHAPKGTPAPVLAKLHAAVTKAVADPDVREKLVSGGLRPIGDKPEEFLARLKGDEVIFREAAASANIRVD